MLTAQGYEVSETPDAADVILLNTCSVREHAEERAFGKMGELKVLKQERPDVVLGIIGCMAKLQKERIFKRLPHVDLIAGPAELYDLPYLLAEIQERRQRDGLQAPSSRLQAIERSFRPLDRKPSGDYRKPGVAAFVTIMEGCDKRCTYCIVPTTRGQEISRPAEEILEEIKRLVESGYREITLLGQNVNSYGKRFQDGSGYKGPLGRLRMLEEEPEALLDFPALLRMIDASVCGLTGPAAARTPRQSSAAGGLLAGRPGPPSPAPCPAAPAGWRGGPRAPRHPSGLRIRFTTSHPFDATPRLFEAMRDCPSVCEWLHLPVQSGSNRILRAMRRGYTREAYLEKIAWLRSLMPDIALTTDLIVGFPGETEEDFRQTVELMREVEYDSAYIFKYSPRPGTDAAAHPDDVPREVKEHRNQVLLALQDEISLARLRRFEGREVEVLIEGPGKHAGQLFGRSRGNHGVIVPARPVAHGAGGEGPAELIGRTVPVTIARATPHTLFGR